MTVPLEYQARDEMDLGPRAALRELIVLSLPTVAQMMSYTVLQFTDTYMLALVGNAEATAAGTAGMFAFSFIGFGMGMLTLVNTLVSQAFGRKDFVACGRYLWQGVWFAVFFSLLVLPTALAGRVPFERSGHEPNLVSLEAAYYQVMIAGAVFKLLSTSYGQFFIAINRPGLVLVATIVGVCTNIFANWVLIFGNLGFPKLGVVGAALGTNLSVAVEWLIMFAFTLRPAIRRTYHALDIRLRLREMWTLIKVGFPAGGQFIADILAWTLFMMTVMGAFGTATLAANVYAFRFWHVSFMPAFGISAAVTALVGRYIGMGRPDISAKRAHLGFYVAAAYMVACGVVFFVLGRQMMRLFTDDPEIIRIGGIVLSFAAVYQFFDAMYIIYNGALRGAGDTLVPSLAVLVGSWLFVVLGAFVVSRQFPQWGPAGPWTVTTIYGGLLGLFLFTRFRRGRWKSIRLHAHVAATADSNLAPASDKVLALD